MLKLAYCDWIANLISTTLRSHDDRFAPRVCRQLEVSHPQLDLDSDGLFCSTKKTIVVRDQNNKLYKITVEEVES